MKTIRCGSFRNRKNTSGVFWPRMMIVFMPFSPRAALPDYLANSRVKALNLAMFFCFLIRIFTEILT